MIDIVLDGQAKKVRSFALTDPPRQVVDLYGIKNFAGTDDRKFDDPLVRGIRLGKHADKVRLVVDLTSGGYKAETSLSGAQITVELRGK